MGLRFLTQLRVDLNPLRKYKYNHNFADTSDEFCLCGFGVEDIYHYLLDCHLFDDIRNALLDNVSGIIGENLRNYSNILLKDVLLYGLTLIQPSEPTRPLYISNAVFSLTKNTHQQ